MTVEEARRAKGRGLLVVCPSRDVGIIERLYTTSVGARWHAEVRLGDGETIPCLVSNLNLLLPPE